MVHKNLLHKTEAGAVRLNLSSEHALLQAASDMQASVQSHQPDAVSDQYLVESMQPVPVAELIVSIRRDAQFGLAITIGAGGILAELLDDVATLLLPVSKDDLAGALSGLKIHALLSGYRGKPAIDMNMLIDTLDRLARLVGDDRPRIAELEINPLFVYQDRVCVIDALIHIQTTE